MKVRHVVLVALAAAVTLTSVAAAGPEAAKQRVAITVTILPSGKGVLTPLKNGALARDTGTFGGNWSPTPDRTMPGSRVAGGVLTWGRVAGGSHATRASLLRRSAPDETERRALALLRLARRSARLLRA